MNRAARLVSASLMLFASAGAVTAGQEQAAHDSRIEAPQIAAQAPDAEQRAPASKAFLDNARNQPAPAPRASLMQSPGDQLLRAGGSAPASQITSRDQSGPAVAQLSKADLDSTLAQLSAAERRVLLQAIEGTDICDNPPRVPAVIALCQSKIEARSQEFTPAAERQLSAEERLLRGDFDNTALPSIGQVINRLARTSAASDDFSNQAIASIALTAPATPAQPGQDGESATQGLGEETQALVNAIINQLGGGAP